MPYMERSTGSITTSQTDAAAINEVQTLELNDIGAGDTYTLTHGGTTTGTITYAADSSAAIKTALELLASITTVTVTSTDDDTYPVTFSGVDGGKNMGPITITGATGFTPTGVTETTPGQSAKTVTLNLGHKYAEVKRIRAGLFEDAATNDLDIQDADARKIFLVTNIDTDVSSVLYDKAIGYDGEDEVGNTAANVLAGVFASPATIIVRTDAPATGSVLLYTKGGYGNSPTHRKRTSGTLTTTSGGAASGEISLGSAFAVVKRVRALGFDTSTDYTVTDAHGRNIWTDTARDADTPAIDVAVGSDGVDQDGNAAADTVETIAKSPLTVTIANGGNVTTGSVTVFVEG